MINKLLMTQILVHVYCDNAKEFAIKATCGA